MSANKLTDKDYLFLSTMLRARSSQFLNEETLERMLSFGNFEEAARVLSEMGWPDMSGMDRAGVDEALSKRREDIFAEVAKICPDKELVDLLRMRYDYHNAKALIKAQAVGHDADSLLSNAGRVKLERLKEAFNTEDFRFLPDTLGKALKEARDVLARTSNPQMADFVLDKANHEEIKRIAKKLDNKYVNGYVNLSAQGSNLKAIVRCIRMGKSEEFLASVLFKDRYLERFVSEYCNSPDSIPLIFAITEYKDAAVLGAEAAKGGRLTEFERACDNVMMKYLRNARMSGFGCESILGFLAAVENDITTARIVLNGLQSGLSVEYIKERLRDTYV